MQETSTSISTLASTEMYWKLFQHCQCTMPYDFTVEHGYFTCAGSGYVIFRAKLSATNPSIDIISALTTLLTDPKKDVRLIINGVGYSVSPGPCGVTVAHLDSPHCFEFTPNSTIPTASPDNTALLAVVVIMCVVLLILLISGGIVCLVMRMRRM